MGNIFSCERLNYLAIDLLDKVGNSTPTEQQIRLMEKVLSSVATHQRLLFKDDLTDREKSCLYLAAKGMSALETAQTLGVQISTINSHRNNIKRKLECNTLAQAVFEGMRYGYVESSQQS